MTRNRAPIFLNCFSRGGSNILWNLFLTHPDVCSPIRETLEIFSVRWRRPRWSGVWASVLARQPRLFDQWHLAPRRPLPPRAQTYIDETLYAWKLKTATDRDMRFKRDGEVYTLEEVRQARLVAKNNNGLVFLSDPLRAMYPEATFVALVRNPVALYESHKRRGLTGSVEGFADYFLRITDKMLQHVERWPRYRIVQFEEILRDPIGMMHALYDHAGLYPDKVTKIRFKAKPHFRADGQRDTEYQEGRHYWFAPEEAHEMLEPKVNAYQQQRLDAGERDALRTRLGDRAERLGYTVSV